MSIGFLNFLKDWNQGQDSFTLTTSGSTGIPQEIELKRDLLIYSSEQTYKKLSFNKLTKILNCISTNKVGGFMNWVRAAHFKLDIQTVEPVSDPMIYLSLGHNFTFVSLVPYQLYAILKNEESKAKLNRFKTVLLGGSAIHTSGIEEIIKMDPVFVHSYGMTETYSHIGLKKIEEQGGLGYEAVGDIQITTGDKTILNGTISSNKQLEIKDNLKWNEDGTFSFLGRKDNVINTGGIKVSPEALELRIQAVNNSLNLDIMVTSIPDKELGNKIILLVSEQKEISFSNLENFEKPKEIFYHGSFLRNENGKLLRKETLKAFLSKVNGEQE